MSNYFCGTRMHSAVFTVALAAGFVLPAAAEPSQGMDHSQMQGMDHGKMEGMDHSQMQGMDHSQMQGMDHSQMQGHGSQQNGGYAARQAADTDQKPDSNTAFN